MIENTLTKMKRFFKAFNLFKNVSDAHSSINSLCLDLHECANAINNLHEKIKKETSKIKSEMLRIDKRTIRMKKKITEIIDAMLVHERHFDSVTNDHARHIEFLLSLNDKKNETLFNNEEKLSSLIKNAKDTLKEHEKYKKDMEYLNSIIKIAKNDYDWYLERLKMDISSYKESDQAIRRLADLEKRITIIECNESEKIRYIDPMAGAI